MSYPERIVPDETSAGILAIHLKRYELASAYCHGKVVLDAACGVGYGTAYLGRTAASVLGVDLDEDAIAYAQERYAAANVSFAVSDVVNVQVAPETFDVVCSFETIEHLREPGAFVAEVARVLKSTGVLIASTPQASETTRSPRNPFHTIEFAAHDFESLLREHFVEIELFGQSRRETRRHRLLRRADVLGLRRRLPVGRMVSALTGSATTTNLTLDDVAIERGNLAHATEIVAICRHPRREPSAPESD